MKKAIYKVITGEYDQLAKLATRTPGWDYIAYVDSPQKSKIGFWQIRPIPDFMHKHEGIDLDDCRIARKCKILSTCLLPEYDLVVYVDGNIDPICDLDQFCERGLGQDSAISIMRHPSRNCLYEEGIACINLGKDRPSVIQNQMLKYQRESYPQNNGLVASGIIIRDHRISLLKMFLANWFNEVAFGSLRDQLSFNYTQWKIPIKYNTMDFGIIGEQFRIRRHGRST